MDLSVIICTYNGARRLPLVLEHLRAQVLPAAVRWEVLVVDNASTDETAQVAQTAATRFPTSLHVLAEHAPGKAHALEKAFRCAQGRLYCIVDDDNLLQSDYLASAVAFLDAPAHADVAAIGGRVFPRFENPASVTAELDSRTKAFLALRDLGDEVRFGAAPIGAGMAGRTVLMREIYRRLGHWLADRVGNGVGSGEDLEKVHVVMCLGWRVAYVPNLRMEHWIPSARLKLEYIDRVSYESMFIAPWLQLLGRNGAGHSRLGHACRGVSSLLRVLKWNAKRILPNGLGGDRRAGHWARFYGANVRGHLKLATHFTRARMFLQALQSCRGDLSPQYHKTSHSEAGI